MKLEATAEVYLNIEVSLDGSIVVTHAFPNHPWPCEVRMYDSEDTPYEGRYWDDIYAALVAWVRGRGEDFFEDESLGPVTERDADDLRLDEAPLGRAASSARPR